MKKSVAKYMITQDNNEEEDNIVDATSQNIIEVQSQLALKYQRKTDRQHILDNPDTYIGSVEKTEQEMWVHDNESGIVKKQIIIISGLYKLFDECIVNCRDHIVRMIQSDSDTKKYVSYINVEFDEKTGIITMENDGNGIDIAKHPEYDLWIPEMIFGHLRTSTNYDKTEKKIVGGKNGFGVKLIFIWSSWGSIETVDHTRGLKYTQEFHRNLTVIDPPVIEKIKGVATRKPYTRISFKPDYQRFDCGGDDGNNITNISSDLSQLFKKRVYDISAISDHSVRKINVSYNNEIIQTKNFQQYINLYIGEKTESARVYESANERWEYAVALSPSHEFNQISFVNGISTYKGGKHVDYIIGQITRKLVDYIEKKKKIKVNANSIKEQLVLFLRCDIENPSFDSQTKDYLNTPSNKFGSTCIVSDSFVEKIAKMGVMDLACSLTEAKENRAAAKKTDGTKVKNIRNIPNFIDANYAGTSDSKDCILILCEGLSASSGIISGLSNTDRNTFGIYPLKGKLLNIRGEQTKRISENKEITDIKKILGLETGKLYKSIDDVWKNLRYGKIMFMCDADADGSHIKGLCINMFHSEWQSLIKIQGFLSFMNTPILRAKKGTRQQLLFYNDGEYAIWRNSITIREFDSWTIKYFKGLGTSTSVEFKEYFKNKKIVDFVYNGEESDDILDMVFNKKRANERKEWLDKYDKKSYLDTSEPRVIYEDFINKELIHFSIYDCERSIPSVVDGLKTSLRKVLFCAFKRNLISEIKVAQFSGYVSENSCYHHGEASLNAAIIGMAQNFTGSNNINLLEPNGQFGTKNMGGDDSASERYIFTQLNTLTRAIFPKADDSVLKFLEDDGHPIEPDYYVPIIPFVLVNGISGIGTGFSCNILAYNPIELIGYLKENLQGKPHKIDDFIPFYKGFKGTIAKTDILNKYLVRGVYEKLSADKIRITELPVKTWIMPYITSLEELTDGGQDKKGNKIPPLLKDFTSTSTETDVNIVIVFPKGKLAELEADKYENNINGVEKILKLTTTISSTNMHLFNAEHKLHKYNNISEIIEEFYTIRIITYRKRINSLITEYEIRFMILDNKMKYILLSLEGKVDLRKKTDAQVTIMLEEEYKFMKVENTYNYLIRLPMNSVTNENVAKIIKEKEDIEKQLNFYRNTTPEIIWLGELNELEKELHRNNI